MAKVWCIQTCDNSGNNRMLDKVVTDKEKGVEWVKNIYPKEKWFFSDYMNYEEKDKNNETAPNRTFFFMHGIDRRNSVNHWIFEQRSVY